MKLLHTPKIQIFFLLLLIGLTALFHSPSKEAILTLLTAFVSCILADLLLQKIRGVKGITPGAAGVSGMIIGMLISPMLPFYMTVVTAVVAMLSKHFLRISNRHVVNPAAFGLLITGFLFSQPVSWWAVSWQQLATTKIENVIFFLILLSPGFVSMLRMRRYRILFSFFVGYALVWSLFLFHGKFSPDILFNTVIVDPTTLFFALVMLPEPMTTPNNKRQQILFGLTVALFTALTSLPVFSAVPDSLIFSLIVANVLFFKLR